MLTAKLSWKRRSLDLLLRWMALQMPGHPTAPTRPRSIFVLRNNDIGDLLIITPLFAALRRLFPKTRIIAGVGRWNLPVLEGNPYVNEVMEVNAPWHNKFVPNQSWPAALRYLLTSREARALRSRRCDVGIDVLGSPQGSILLLRGGMGWRLGVTGYAGGAGTAQQVVTFNPDEHVGRSALRFAQLLGAKDLPENRPQLYLTATEYGAAEKLWTSDRFERDDRERLVIGAGVGWPNKAWPEESWVQLIKRVVDQDRFKLVLVGTDTDYIPAARLAAIDASILNLAGRISLRETFAMVAAADHVLCHSSMLMHAAGAFAKPAVVLLGNCFSDARAHARQWGYPETRVLGRDHDHPELYSPEEVMAVLDRMASRENSPTPGRNSERLSA